MSQTHTRYMQEQYLCELLGPAVEPSCHLGPSTMDYSQETLLLYKKQAEVCLSYSMTYFPVLSYRAHGFHHTADCTADERATPCWSPANPRKEDVRIVKPCKVRVLWRTAWEGNLQEMAAAGSWAIKLEKLLFLMKTKVQLFAFTSSPPTTRTQHHASTTARTRERLHSIKKRVTETQSVPTRLERTLTALHWCSLGHGQWRSPRTSGNGGKFCQAGWSTPQGCRLDDTAVKKAQMSACVLGPENPSRALPARSSNT